MLILLPVALFCIPALALLVIRVLRPAFTYSWVIAALAALLAWIAFGVLRFFLPQALVIPAWQPAGLLPVQPGFILDRASWLYDFCISTLVLAVILTATARARYPDSALDWAGSLLIGGLGVLSVSAADPVTLLIAWSALDLVNLAVLLGNASSPSLTWRTVLAYGVQTLGMLMVLGAVISGGAGEGPIRFEGLAASSTLYLLLGAGLRLGVFPLHLPYAREPRMLRGPGTLLRLIPAASALMVLSRLPGAPLPSGWGQALVGLAALAALYGALMWISAADEVEGRAYWVLGLAALAVTCAVRGDPAGSRAWGAAMLLSGGLLFIYSARSRGLASIWILGLWGFTGLPFSPASDGWDGLLLKAPLQGMAVIFLISVGLFQLGYLRHALRRGEELKKMEPWVRGFYPAGLLAVPIALLVIALAGWKGSWTVGTWWAGVMVSLLTAAALALRAFRPGWLEASRENPIVGWLRPILTGILQGIGVLFRLDWLYRAAWGILGGVGWLLSTLTTILEGDGGVLWALLLLTLVVTLVQGAAH